jgi:predicted DNA-binding protein with PD1-like motif
MTAVYQLAAFLMFICANLLVCPMYSERTSDRRVSPSRSAVDDAEWYQQKLNAKEVASYLQPRAHVLRLSPGEDLLESLWKYGRVVNLTAASVVTAVGSLTTMNIRYANNEDGTSLSGYFEIVALVGQIDFQNATKLQESDAIGSGHVHIACSDGNGVTIGGHLLSGNIVYTTVEITLLSYDNAIFTRELDNAVGGSGYEELKVYRQRMP